MIFLFIPFLLVAGESQLDCVYEQLNTISNVTCDYVDDLCATLSMTSGGKYIKI